MPPNPSANLASEVSTQPSNIGGQTAGDSLFLTIFPTSHRGRRQGSTSAKPPRPKRYPCPQCDLMFDRPCSVKTHLYSHTGEKPFPCDYCKSAFPTKSNLYRHRKTCKNYNKYATQKEKSRVSSRSKPGAAPQDDADETVSPSTPDSHHSNTHRPVAVNQSSSSIVQSESANTSPQPYVPPPIHSELREASRSPLDGQHTSSTPMSPSMSCVSSESSNADMSSHHTLYSDSANKHSPHQGLGHPARYGRNVNPDYPTDSTGRIGSSGVNNDSSDHPYGLDPTHDPTHSYLGEYSSSSSVVETRGGELPLQAAWNQPPHESTHNARLHRPRSDHASHMYAIAPSEMDMGRQVWGSSYYTGSPSSSGGRSHYSNLTMTPIDPQQSENSPRTAPHLHFQTVHAPEFTSASPSTIPYRAQHPQPSVIPVPPNVGRNSPPQPQSHSGPGRRNAVYELHLPSETFDMISATPSAWPPAGGNGYQSGHNIHAPPYHSTYPRSD